MNQQEKLKFIEDAIVKLFGKTLVITPGSVLIELSLDSLDIVELQMYYEDTYAVEIDDFVSIKTVQDLMDCME